MKRTQKFTVTLAALTLAASAFLFGACGFGKTDPGRLTTREETKAEFSSTALSRISALDDCELDLYDIDSQGLVVAVKDSNYILYDLTTNKTILSLIAGRPQKISAGLYCVQEENGAYTLYHKKGNITYAGGSVTEDYFTDSKGVRAYIDANGEFATEENPLVPILTYEQAQNALKAEDYYLSVAGNYAFNVFDETGKYRNSFDLYNAFKIGADDEVQGLWAVKDTLFLQTVRVLPDDNKSYDLFLDGKKLDLNTFGYDIKNSRTKELIAFDFMVESIENLTEEYAVLRGYDVDDRKCSQEILQAFGADGNVYVDLQKLLPGTNSYSKESCYVYLSNNAETVAYHDGDKIFEGAIYSKMNGFIKGQGYWKNGENLYIYNDEGELSLIVTDFYSDCGATPDGNIYYTRKIENANGTFYSLYLYQGEAEKTKKSDKDKEEPVTTEIGEKALTPGRIDDGFYIRTVDETDCVYALFGESPQTAILTEADGNSVNVQIVTVDKTDYAVIHYTVSDAPRYTLVTMTNSYQK